MKTTSILVLATFLVVALFVPATASADCWQDVADCFEAVGRLLDQCDGMTGSAADWCYEAANALLNYCFDLFDDCEA